MDIQWLGHAGFRCSGEKIIYFDPFQVSKSFNDADAILISHEHYDHCDPASIKKLVCAKTVIACPPDCTSKLRGLEFKQLLLVEPNKEYQIYGLYVATIPAYNINKFRSHGVVFHPREQHWVGYVITIDNVKIYHAGDTDKIPEMRTLEGIDIAFVPVSGTYVMSAQEAADAVQSFHPKLSMPMHYGSIVGSVADASKFKALLAGKQNVRLPSIL